MSSNRQTANNFFIKKTQEKKQTTKRNRAEAAIGRQHKEKSKLKQQ
jgi:hypothetical protein